MRAIHHVIAATAVAASLGWDRLVLLVAIIGALTWLAVEGKVDPTAPVAIFTAILGYVFGASGPAATRAAHEVSGGAEG